MTPPPAALPVVLVVDDEPRSLEALRRALDENFEVLTAASAAEAEAVMEREFVQIVLCDQRMPDLTGVEFLKRVRSRWPDTVRMILSGYAEVEDIIAGINEAGIWQYLLKPWHPDQLLLTLKSAAEIWRLQQENQRLSIELRESPHELAARVATRRRQLAARDSFEALIRAPGSPLDAVCELARRIAPHDLPVLLQGESGTGKELLARALHHASARAEGPFVVENCAAMPDTLLEAELFGHKKGAFTGAYEDRVGLFQQADGGTLFLDEVGDTSPAMQVKLLRALQEGEVRPVGSSRSVRVDVRIITATHRDLEADVLAGRFREDLYYRLAGITLTLPPLRERPADIPLLVTALLQKSGVSGRRFSDAALELMCRYRWPGNVRELANEVRRALALAREDEMGPELLSPRLHAIQAPRPAGGELGTLKERLAAFETEVLREALARHRGNKSRIAAELGLTRVGLRMKLERLGLLES
ncbi:sigma-54-dependent transcriptional regulator [Sulfuricystis thermophila]|uniref:sigma-54-dependent transcriptional regulator n=1 Tax=Sulfuricystis thermophila TaxID=2496847 RepID=UPI001036CF94|nr:sigma-54 dependent transcriptional regulator [Sulfuricystis thermophila]